MEIREIVEKERNEFDAVVSHPLQTYEWGEFREKMGIKVIREGFFDGKKLVSGFSLTLHQIPKTNWTIGYLPKGDFPDGQLITELKKIGKREKCVFIQLEPNIKRIRNHESIRQAQDKSGITNQEKLLKDLGLSEAAHPLFTKYTFVLDLTQSEDELLKRMHPKARYNIRVAHRYGVDVVEDNSKEAFEEYWKLMEETTMRQNFYAHSKKYHQLVWETIGISDFKFQISNIYNEPSAHLFLAKYGGRVLTAWMLFVFKDTLYYPYGASSSEHRETMHSSSIMWEAVRFGKKLGLKKFDLWGAMGENPDQKDPWYGFHDFKRKFGPEHVEFIGSYDLVLNPLLYKGYALADKLRWTYLKFKK